jgi:hypothetical protein
VVENAGLGARAISQKCAVAEKVKNKKISVLGLRANSFI